MNRQASRGFRACPGPGGDSAQGGVRSESRSEVQVPHRGAGAHLRGITLLIKSGTADTTLRYWIFRQETHPRLVTHYSKGYVNNTTALGNASIPACGRVRAHNADSALTVPFDDITQQMRTKALRVYYEAILWPCLSFALFVTSSVFAQSHQAHTRMSYTPKKVDCEVNVDTSGLSGKTAIVTGGADGLGRAYVRALHAAG
jgi:hypothetical protein